MKNIAIGILSIWLLAACDPVVDNKEMGGIVSESELKLDVHPGSCRSYGRAFLSDVGK